MSKFSYFHRALFLGAILYPLFAYEMIPDGFKYAIAGYCLWIFFSPISWFNLKKCVLWFFERSPKEGMPTKEKLSILIMLFRLRYLEIYDVYAGLRHRQEEAGDENWILRYLKEEAFYLSDEDYWSHNKDKKIEKRDKKAQAVFERLFDFEKFSCDTDRLIQSTTDLEIEFQSFMALQKLAVLKSFGCFKWEINALIKDYQFLEDTYQERFGRFSDFFINWLGKAERRIAYQSIGSTWLRLFNILKAYLIFFEAQDGCKDEFQLLFREVKDLEEMSSCLSWELRRGNMKSKKPIGFLKESTQSRFFEKDMSKHLWSKSFL